MWFALSALGIFIALVRKDNNKVNTDTPTVANILRTIRTLESGGNYTIQTKNPKSDASGAYQFISTTWGGFGGYKHAKDAPPEVQDEKARQLVKTILRNHNNDIRWVPAVWYVGDRGARTMDWNTVPRYNRSTINQYVTKWMALFNRFQQTQPKGGGKALS